MKALVICPAHRPEVAALAAADPLANVAILGKTLIGLWLEHLAGLGAQEVLVLTSDRADEVRQCVKNGARWGLQAEVMVESHELTRLEAYLKYRSNNRYGWLPEPFAINVLDHLPTLPGEKLFVSYRGFFERLCAWLRQRADDSRVGVREISPGIFVGLRARIAPTARLLAPCWVGEEVRVGPSAILGPEAIVEDRAMVDFGCEISHSLVGPDTFVGALTEITDSIACGSLLINWRSGSWTSVPDAILCSSLRAEAKAPTAGTGMERTMAAALLAFTLPLAAWAVLKAKWTGQRAFRTRLAVRPDARPALERKTITYYELAAARGFLRRWPQLWNIMRGDFAWLGHRPLSPSQVAVLSNDFERFRLAWPLGLVSLAEDLDQSHGREPNADSAPGASEDGSTSGVSPVRLRLSGQTLSVSGLTELGAANAPAIGDQCARALTPHHRLIEVDLSETVFMDACGVGTLLFLHRLASRSGGRVRLLRPRPAVRQFLELTRVHRTVEIADIAWPAVLTVPHRMLASEAVGALGERSES